MKICVIGAGSWGTALAMTLARNGHDVNLWFRSAQKAEKVREDNENKEFLLGVPLPEGINILSDIEEAAKGCEVFVQSVSSGGIREALGKFKPFIPRNSIVVNSAKGLEDGSLKRLSEVISEILPNVKVAVLSGPSHAEEVAKGVPTAIVSACEDLEIAEIVQDIFMNEYFRVYTNTDVTGVELGAALKNVIALAAGISDGMGNGDNTKAALMTRGIKEIGALGIAMGADINTFSGLTGIGDLIVTCTSMHSRNRRAGILLGQGKSLKEALAEVRMVVEGVNSTRAAYGLAEKYHVDCPIIGEVYNVLEKGKDPKFAVKDLMTRDKKEEHNSEFIMGGRFNWQ